MSIEAQISTSIPLNPPNKYCNLKNHKFNSLFNVPSNLPFGYDDPFIPNELETYLRQTAQLENRALKQINNNLRAETHNSNSITDKHITTSSSISSDINRNSSNSSNISSNISNRSSIDSVYIKFAVIILFFVLFYVLLGIIIVNVMKLTNNKQKKDI